MKTLKIEIPEGYEIEKFDEQVGEIKFKEKPKKVMDRIKSDKDVFAGHGITQEEFEKSCEGLFENEVAARFINLLVELLNEGWEADFDDSDQWKYDPYFIGGSSGFRFGDYVRWVTGSCVGSRLCLNSSELATHAGKNFTSWYKKLIIKKK